MANLTNIFPVCRELLGPKFWNRISVTSDMDPTDFPVFLKHQGGPEVPPYVFGLAQIELSRYIATRAPFPKKTPNALTLNPTLQINAVTWKNLAALFKQTNHHNSPGIISGNEIIITWCMPDREAPVTRTAEPADLLAIKLISEDIDPIDAASEAGVTVGLIDAVMREAVWNGLLISPPSILCREDQITETTHGKEFSTAEVFTLQWHLTQQCDLHCRHCYDRSDRKAFPFERVLSLFDELRNFCRSRFVRGQVSLSGGNPLLYPHFMDLYRAAAERDLMIAILGNAIDRTTIEKIISIQMPVYYQVSLEGLEKHNDEIRGSGNFKRTVNFLSTLTEMGVPNMVMLTLTRHNMGQVIALAKELEGITGGLTFNRLALFGEGACLELPKPEEYRNFLETYSAALDKHPVLKLKDNHLNTLFERDNSGLFGGCAGYGCGAAFNFVSILSDGEVHACRKFPSPIGNILTDDLESVYSSMAARRYRSGSSACSGCTLNAVCRGCPAVTASLGLDPFTDLDPYCFRHHISIPPIT